MNQTILKEADELINGERAAAYGAGANIEDIAALWSTFLNRKLQDGEKVTPTDVCWMMSLLKTAREMHKHKRDNAVDAAGYIGLTELFELDA